MPLYGNFYYKPEWVNGNAIQEILGFIWSETYMLDKIEHIPKAQKRNGMVKFQKQKRQHFKELVLCKRMGKRSVKIGGLRDL